MTTDGGERERIVTIVAAFMKEILNNEQRLAVMKHFCKECGCVQPEDSFCQCWNDE